LLRRSPTAVTKADLHRELWPDTFVSDVSLAVLVAEIRRAIGDSARRPSFVRTVNRFGYAFVGTAIEPLAPPAGSAAIACSLTWGSERARLFLEKRARFGTAANAMELGIHKEHDDDDFEDSSVEATPDADLKTPGSLA